MNVKTKHLLLLFLLPVFCTAQNVSVKWGEVHSLEGVGKNLFSDIIGADDNHYYYAVMGTLGKQVLEVYDYHHKLLYTRDLQFSVADKTAQIQSIRRTKNHTYAFSYADNAAKDKVYMYASKVSTDGKIDPNPISILDTYQDLLLSANNRVVTSLTGGGLNLIQSRDLNLLGFLTTTKAKMSSNVFVTVMDENLKEKWSSEIQLSSKFSYGSISITHPYLANDGTLFILGSIKHDDYRHKKEFGPNEPHRVLFIATATGVKEVDLDYSSTVHLQRAQVASVSGNEVIVAGIYNTEYDCGGGAVAIKIDITTGKILSFKEQPIKMEDLDYGYAKGTLKKGGCVKGEDLVSCKELDNGTIIVSSVQGVSTQSSSSTTDKLFFAFDANLKPLYTFGIKGWAEGSTPFTVVPLKNEYVVVYYDADSRGNVMYVYVNEKGEHTTPQALPSPKMFFRPWYTRSVDDKRIFIGCEGGNFGIISGKSQFGVLTVK